ncbi:receptor-transporting protein 3-like [Engystomops pustulosus]|uniref:receptor-transporting protein 3-like n=1 Tax=Engystomops pustulosus TaxID=76066 RepID=UPI003AFA5AA6
MISRKLFRFTCLAQPIRGMPTEDMSMVAKGFSSQSSSFGLGSRIMKFGTDLNNAIQNQSCKRRQPRSEFDALCELQEIYSVGAMAGSSVGNIWIDTFACLQKKDLEEKYRKKWILQFNYRLKDSLTEEQKKNGWKISQTTKFACFTCTKCSHFWNSGRVTLIFHYCLRQSKTGTVLLRPFSQMCRACDNDNFINATFKEESVKAILQNIIQKIRKNCYREKIDFPTHSVDYRIIRTKPHERDLCEACLEGVCNREQDGF